MGIKEQGLYTVYTICIYCYLHVHTYKYAQFAYILNHSLWTGLRNINVLFFVNMCVCITEIL